MEQTLVRLGRRIAMAFGLGRLTADTDLSGSTQRVQASLGNGELRSGIPLLQQYGFASRPRPGTDVFVCFLSGDRTRAVAIASNDQRGWPGDLKPGEVCVYHPGTGSRVLMQADGSIRLTPASGTVQVEGTLRVTGDVTAGSISLQKHVHGGVQAGGAKTGTPE